MLWEQGRKADSKWSYKHTYKFTLWIYIKMLMILSDISSSQTELKMPWPSWSYLGSVIIWIRKNKPRLSPNKPELYVCMHQSYMLTSPLNIALGPAALSLGLPGVIFSASSADGGCAWAMLNFGRNTCEGWIWTVMLLLTIPVLYTLWHYYCNVFYIGLTQRWIERFSWYKTQGNMSL